MISAMGCAMFLENLVYVTIGAQLLAYPRILRGSLQISNAFVGYLDIVALCVATICIAGLTYFLNKTKTGTAIRAASRDMTIASTLGINIDLLLMVVFALAGLFAGVAGVYLGMKYQVSPTMGVITTKAFIAAVIGGIGSLPGAIVGGLVLGLVETFVSMYISTTLRDVFSFSMLICLLLVKPQGLFGRVLDEKL